MENEAVQALKPKEYTKLSAFLQPKKGYTIMLGSNFSSILKTILLL
jgi:hypothetical protein